MRRIDDRSFRELIDSEPTLVLGAGVSRPLLPTAKALKFAIARNALRCSEYEKNPPWERVEAALHQRHLTLELLCSMFLYRCVNPGDVGPIEMLYAVCDVPGNIGSIVEKHPYSAYFSFLAGAGKLGPILTTNFDVLLTSAINGATVVSHRQLVHGGHPQPASGDICTLHGTFHKFDPALPLADQPYTPPSSTTARGLARPFDPAIEGYVVSALSRQQPVLFIGYSGGDHYDMNQVLLRMERNNIKNWYWLARSGEKSVSEIVKASFGDRLYHAEADRLLYTCCQQMQNEEGIDIDAKLPEPDKPEDNSWQQRLTDYFDLLCRQTSARRFSAFLHDIESNFHGAWLTTEHYYLTSVGLDDRYAFHMAGVPLLEERSGQAEREVQELLKFRGESHFATLFLAQYRYALERDRLWSKGRKDASSIKENESFGTNLIMRAIGRVFPGWVFGFVVGRLFFRQTRALLKRAQRQFHRRIKRSEIANADDLSRPEDRALELVGAAIVENYLGLIPKDVGDDSPRDSHI